MQVSRSRRFMPVGRIAPGHSARIRAFPLTRVTGPILRMNGVQWDEGLDANLGGCFNMCKAVWDGMIERGFGRVVNIGSINGQAGQYGQVNYAAAKSGIHGFTKALAQEGATKGITLTPIARGNLQTDMVRV